MRLVIWCPTLNPGGGARLLVRLVEAFVKHSSISRLGVATFHGSANIFDKLKDHGGRFNIIRLPNPQYYEWSSLVRLSRLQQLLRSWSRHRARTRLQRAFNKAAKNFDIA